tara:strand:- start:5219 stop:6253 length:1035 start_codon:yes stop_codon:yes gene_type:complete
MYQIQKIDAEITNRCNAACPQCPRTGTYNGVSKLIDASGMHDVPVEVIEGILTSKYGFGIDKFTYCGNYGDPIMHPKALEIFEMVSFYGVKYQRIDSNASARNPEWWSNVGKIPGFTTQFAIDGLEDTNHLYRVKTNWSRIMENAEAFIKAGGNATWLFLVFEHNQHQVEEAKELSEKMGFKDFKIKLSTRNFTPGDPLKPKVNLYKRKKNSEVKKANIKFSNKEKFQSDLIKEGLKQFAIKPMCENSRQLFLTSDSRIIPCCHVQSTMWERKFLPADHKKEPEFADFIEINRVKTELDKYSFDEIVDSYTEHYPVLKSHWDEKNITTCNRKCGSNFKNEVRPY